MKNQQQVSSLGKSLMRKNSYHYQPQNFETEKAKPPISELSVRGLKSPNSIKNFPLNESRDSGTQLLRQESSKAMLLSEGEPHSLPQAFGKKISCVELNKSQRLQR